MTEKEQEIINRLITAVRDMDEDLAEKASIEALQASVDPLTAINSGLVEGMNQASVLYDKEEYFVPELLLCSDALYTGLDILTPHIKEEPDKNKSKVVIGVVEGDTHDIGKNLVKIMLEVSGFEVYDLGRDVQLDEFVSKVMELKVEFLCMSTLMSTTMDGMGKVVQGLINEGVRDSVKVLVGGGPLSKAFADKIGADGYASNATGAVKLAHRLSNLSPATV